MNEPLSSRSLLLEQLESRCLLAGGMLLFSHVQVDGPLDRHDPNRPQDRPRNDRPAEVQSLPGASSQLDSHRNHNNQHPDNQRPLFQLGGRPGRPLPPPIQSPPPSVIYAPDTHATLRDEAVNPPQTLTISIPVIVIRVGEPSERVTSVSEGLGSDKPPRGEPLAVAKPTSPAAEQVLVTAKDSPLPAKREAAAVALASNRNDAVASPANTAKSAVTEARVTEAEVSAEGTSASSIPLAGDDVSVRSPMAPIASGSTSDHRGMIDSFPLLRSTPQNQQRDAEESPWELGGDTLRRLRDVTQQPTAQPRELAVGPTDAVIALWFQGPGGLVDVETDGAPLIADEATTGIVDIVLDATFGLHRTLDLVASASTPSTNESVRDAVLAAIAGEQSETAAPIQEPEETRLSGLAYPGAVLAAAMLAIAQRHRPANALLATRRARTSGDE